MKCKVIINNLNHNYYEYSVRLLVFVKLLLAFLMVVSLVWTKMEQKNTGIRTLPASALPHACLYLWLLISRKTDLLPQGC